MCKIMSSAESPTGLEPCFKKEGLKQCSDTEEWLVEMKTPIAWCSIQVKIASLAGFRGINAL